VGKAYWRVNCVKRRLCVLFNADSGFLFGDVLGNTWVKDAGTKLTEISPSPVFAIVNGVSGWEACYTLPLYTDPVRTKIEMSSMYGELSKGSATPNTGSTGSVLLTLC